MRLIVEEGYNRGAEFDLGLDGPALLGRGADCQVHLVAEGISRQHAKIYREGALLVLEDLQSRNGTRVNGVPVDSATLSPGDRIAVGDVRLVLLPQPPANASPRSSLLVKPTREISLTSEVGLGLRHGRDREELLGSCPQLAALLQRLARVAPKDATVLVQGESGTGKELIARGVHRLSPRRRGPWVVLNCVALPDSLLESELFGHERGAFTGATARRVGLAEAADGGTLFLDEVGELSASAQAKLLRFLESHEVLRLGATTPVKVDVRVVAATHRDLEARAAEGEFREDLLHRLRVVELQVPPLRERGGDLRLLAETFAEQLSDGRMRLSEAALSAIEGYAWPGNVRELRNAIESATILAASHEMGPEDLPARIGGTARAPRVPNPVADDSEVLPLREVERRAIQAALVAFEGHRSNAARALGIDRKTLRGKIKSLGLEEA